MKSRILKHHWSKLGIWTWTFSPELFDPNWYFRLMLWNYVFSFIICKNCLEILFANHTLWLVKGIILGSHGHHVKYLSPFSPEIKVIQSLIYVPHKKVSSTYLYLLASFFKYSTEKVQAIFGNSWINVDDLERTNPSYTFEM